MRLFFAISILIPVVCLSLNPMDGFRKAYDLWVSGNYEEAKRVLEETLYKPVGVEDLPKFLYLKARIEIDLGNVEDALKTLQSVLVIDPSDVTVLSLMKEIEFLTGRKGFERAYKARDVFEIRGFKDGIEYFYTIDDMAVWGDDIFLLDRVNGRLLEYDGSELVKTVELPFDALNIEVSPEGVPYVSSTDGSIYEVEGSSVKIVAKGLRVPILAGFDRTGTLWGVSGFSIFSLREGKLNVRKIPWGNPLIMDVELTREGIWILDVLNKRLVLMDRKDLRMLKEVPLFFDVRAFEVIPYGMFVLLTSDGNLLLMDERQNTINLKLNTADVVSMEYSYPVLMLADWKEHTVAVMTLAGNEPVFVKIDSLDLSRDRGEIRLRVRFETLYGDPIPLAGRFAFVSVEGGRRTFDYGMKLERVDEYKSDVDFLFEKLPLLPRGVGYDVVIPGDSFHEPDEIVTIRDKSVRLFTPSRPESESLRELVIMSGGDWNGEPESSTRQEWVLRVPYSPSVSEKIVPVSVGMVLGAEVYMDTMYVIERGVVNEGE